MAKNYYIHYPKRRNLPILISEHNLGSQGGRYGFSEYGYSSKKAVYRRLMDMNPSGKKIRFIV